VQRSDLVTGDGRDVFIEAGEVLPQETILVGSNFKTNSEVISIFFVFFKP